MFKKRIAISVLILLLIPNMVFAEYQNVDLRVNMQPVYEQKYGSCSIQASIGALEYQLINKKYIDIKPSRAFSYYVGRKEKGQEYQNAGVPLETAMIGLTKYGYASRDEFGENNFFDVEPSFNALYNAIQRKVPSYYEIKEFEEIVQHLQNGIPVTFNTFIQEWYGMGTDGIVRGAYNWNFKWKQFNHAMVIVGYLTDFNIDGKLDNVFIIRNSYGEYEGDKGYYYIPAQELFDYNIGEMFVVRVDDLPLRPINTEVDEEQEDYIFKEMTIYTTRTDEVGSEWASGEYYGYVFFKEGYEVSGNSYKRQAEGYLYKREYKGFSEQAIAEKQRLVVKSKQKYLNK